MGYDKIVLNENLTVDYLMYISETVDEKSLPGNNIDTTDRFYIPSWNDNKNIEILCTYDDKNLYSSTIKNLNQALQGFLVYRQEKCDSKMHLVAEVDENCTNIVDYLVANNTQYIYTVIPITETELGVVSTGSEITTDWFDWSLTSLTEVSKGIYVPDDVWILQLNISSDSFTQNIDTNTLLTSGKYPKVVKGASNYSSGSITCMLGNMVSVNNEFNDNVARIKAWNEFVGSGKQCILKDRKGMIYRVVISDSPTRSYDDDVIDQPTTISFSFTEIGDVDDISVFEKK